MDEAFTRAAFTLEKDGISQPVVTSFGIHLIRVTDVKAGSEEMVRRARRTGEGAIAEDFSSIARKESAAEQSRIHRQEPVSKARHDGIGAAEVIAIPDTPRPRQHSFEVPVFPPAGEEYEPDASAREQCKIIAPRPRSRFGLV